MLIHPDRLFPADPDTRKLARSLYQHIAGLPIVSPHGHTQASWFTENQPFPDPAKLFVQPDHYIYRMLYSQGISMDDLEIGKPEIADPCRVWKIFAKNYYLFRGTPTSMWLDYEFQELFALTEPLSEKTADHYFDTIAEKLSTPEFLPRALYERFRIEVLATTDSPLDSLADHKALRDSDWKGRVIPAFRPDPVVDPDFAGFTDRIAQLGQQTHENTETWAGYLNALRLSRVRFRSLGATSTDHGHPTALTADLSPSEAAALYEKVRTGKSNPAENELFRADAHRNGRYERGRWPGDADSSRLRSQP
jgi:glucuronate isomerase